MVLVGCSDREGSLTTPVAEDSEPQLVASLDVVTVDPIGIWTTPQEVAALPTEGAAWDNVAAQAERDCGPVDLEASSNPQGNVCVMAKALAFARTGDSKLRADVVESLEAIASLTTYDFKVLPLARQVVAYVIAADLVSLDSVEPEMDQRFRIALRSMLDFGGSGGGVRNLTDCHERRPNNWGTNCGAARAAIAVYLGDAELLDRVAQVFKGWLGDRDAYSGFKFGSDRSWHCDESQPVGINPVGCSRDGNSIDGVLPDDQRRSGSYDWPPTAGNPAYGSLQGAFAQAIILHRQGYEAFDWEDQALLRAFKWLHEQADAPAKGDDVWQSHVVNHFYGADFAASVPARPGKNVGWTDWSLAGSAERRSAPAKKPKADPPEDDPPSNDPPTSDPPSGDPPTNDPPSGDPPSGDPPTNDPPSGDPPTNDPPTNEPTPNVGPRAEFSADCTDLRCEFNASASRDSDGSISTFQWDFGDGSEGSGSVTAHQYGGSGDYRVRLVVTDNDGADGTASRTVTVEEAPPPSDPPPPPPPSSSSGIFVSRSDISRLPTSGSSWDQMKREADSSCGSPDLANQDDDTNVCILSKALVYARIGGSGYRNDVLAALGSIARSGRYNGRALALGRELAAYIVAADVIDLNSADPSLDGQFRNKLRELLTTSTDGGPDNLVECHEKRANNWGTHCGASRAAIAAYLGDQSELARVAQVFKGWLGDRSSYAGFDYGDLSWQCDRNRPVGINPSGCTRDGRPIGGVLPDDQRRNGGFSWPPPKANYVWGGLAGALGQAVILHRAGYDAFNWEDRALLRAVEWLHTHANFPATGDDEWQPHIVNSMYGGSFPAQRPAQPGKNLGWTDWLMN